MLKKLNKIIIFTLLIIISIIITCPKSNIYENEVSIKQKYAESTASQTEYFDYGSIKTIQDDYSYSSIYLTSETEIKLIKQEGAGTVAKGTYNNQETFQSISGMKPGSSIKVLITKCAVNKKAEVLDVVLTVDNVKVFEGQEEKGQIYFSVNIGNVQVPKSQMNPKEIEQVPLGKGKPIEFGFSTTTAQADFTMQYFKTGTYKETTGTGEDGGITHVNGFYRDLDVPVAISDDKPKGPYETEIMEGNEGVIPLVGKSYIYYNKNNLQPSEEYEYKKNHPNVQYTLFEKDNGIAAKPGTTAEVNAYWFATTAFMLTENLKDSKFQFTYSGAGCGISYFFSSPYPYESSAPVKKASTDYVIYDEQFNYQISQYIANNYYGSLFSYKELYNDLYSDTKYDAITITDDIDSRLNINTDEVKIVNEVGEIQSGFWDLKVDDHNITATAKKEGLESANFYAHTYTIIVPVTFPSTVTDQSQFKNTAKTTFKIEDKTETKESSLNLDFKYKLTVHYYDKDTGEAIADPDIKYYNANDEYTTNYDKVGDGWNLDTAPDNAKGTINKNITVDYYFTRVIENPDTGAFIHIIVISFMSLIIAGIIVISQRHHKIYKV